MCGLVGIWGMSEPDPPALLKSVAHRGPDGSGWAMCGNAFLGHTRLAIQDPSDLAAQPASWGPNITVTYAGECWNADALRAVLPGPWRSTGDTEVITRLIAHHGVAGLDLIDGMFALVWHDASDGSTWLARDRYGKIPLYLSESIFGISWASEIAAVPEVWAADEDKAQPIEPGTARNLLTGEVVRWATDNDQDACPVEDPAEVLALLRRGVRKRLLSDRPVCFLLSGGLDSSLILALARELHPSPVGYTAVHNPMSEDLHYARKVAAEFDVPLVEVPVPEPTTATIAEAVRAVEVPMKAQVEIALGCLPLARQMAADGFRVVLSGEAADEVFGGYGGMAIQGAQASDARWTAIRRAQVQKMARGNFMRLNKVFMAAGVEARMPFMERDLVEGVLRASKAACPPGKGLLKAAAAGVVPADVIARPKATFQGSAGLIASAARVLRGENPTRHYHEVARAAYGFLPVG